MNGRCSDTEPEGFRGTFNETKLSVGKSFALSCGAVIACSDELTWLQEIERYEIVCLHLHSLLFSLHYDVTYFLPQHHTQ